MRDQSIVPTVRTETTDTPNRAARRARGKNSRQPLPAHPVGTSGRAASRPAHVRQDYAARRSG